MKVVRPTPPWASDFWWHKQRSTQKFIRSTIRPFTEQFGSAISNLIRIITFLARGRLMLAVADIPGTLVGLLYLNLVMWPWSFGWTDQSLLSLLFKSWLAWFVVSRISRWALRFDAVRSRNPMKISKIFFLTRYLFVPWPREYYQAQLSDDPNSPFVQEDVQAPRFAIRLAAAPIIGYWVHCGLNKFNGKVCRIKTWMSPPETFEERDVFGREAKILGRLATSLSANIERWGSFSITRISEPKLNSESLSRIPVEIGFVRSNVDDAPVRYVSAVTPDAELHLSGAVI